MRRGRVYFEIWVPTGICSLSSESRVQTGLNPRSHGLLSQKGLGNSFGLVELVESKLCVPESGVVVPKPRLKKCFTSIDLGVYLSLRLRLWITLVERMNSEIILIDLGNIHVTNITVWSLSVCFLIRTLNFCQTNRNAKSRRKLQGQTKAVSPTLKEISMNSSVTIIP